MFVDASAIVSMVAPEEDGQQLSERLAQSDQTMTSAIAVYEAVLGLARSRDMAVESARWAVEHFLQHTTMQVVPITAEIGRAALEAFERYGRGRHPARLNMGDCFAYACARSLGVPLLYKGDDFAQTDIAVA